MGNEEAVKRGRCSSCQLAALPLLLLLLLLLCTCDLAQNPCQVAAWAALLLPMQGDDK